MFLFEPPFPKPTPFELKKSFLDKNRVLRQKRRLQSSLLPLWGCVRATRSLHDEVPGI